MILRRKPRIRSGIDHGGPFRSASHTQHVRGYCCVICGTRDGIEAGHVRWRTDGSMSVKPSDFWTLPLCRSCHRLGEKAQHSQAEMAFYASHGIKDPHQVCRDIAYRSPDPEVREHARTMRARL